MQVVGKAHKYLSTFWRKLSRLEQGQLAIASALSPAASLLLEFPLELLR